MIQPTVGRVVLFTPSRTDESLVVSDGQKCAAIIAFVWSNSLVNLTVFDPNGMPTNRTSVPLVQGDLQPKPDDGYFCEWMDYQKGQAANTEALEEKLNSAALVSGDLQPSIRIVILQRGWVAVGKFSQNGEQCRLDNAAIIRRWGTSRGLGQIAAEGPTDSTVLDKCPPLKFHVLTVVSTMDCEADKWAGLL